MAVRPPNSQDLRKRKQRQDRVRGVLQPLETGLLSGDSGAAVTNSVAVDHTLGFLGKGRGYTGSGLKTLCL